MYSCSNDRHFTFPCRLTNGNDVIFYDEGCATCTLDYLEETVGPPLTNYGVGLEHQFASEGFMTGFEREYAIRAIVVQGEFTIIHQDCILMSCVEATLRVAINALTYTDSI